MSEEMNSRGPTYPRTPSARPSFGSLAEALGEQVERESLIAQAPERAGVYRDIVRALADAYVHKPETPSRVEDGIEYGILQEVYAELTSIHVQAVADRFLRYGRRVYSPRLWFQAALYNILGELESGVENAFAVGRGEHAGLGL